MRFIVLAAYAAAHVAQGRAQTALAHASNLTFTSLLLRRYRDGLGAEVGLSTRQYINFHERHPRQSYRSLRSGWLFLADILKTQGLLDDAEAVYRRAAANDRLAYAALCGLGDLLLMKARWAREFSLYADVGQAINPSRMRGVQDWRSATFEEAIDVLKLARVIAPHDERAPWLMAMAYILADCWPEAIEHVQILDQVAVEPSLSDLGHLRMKAVFPVAPDVAVFQGNEQLRGWVDSLGSSWEVKAVKICRGNQLPASDGFVTEPVSSERVLSLDAGFSFQGQFTRYSSQITFPQPYSTACPEVTILPLFGGVVAGSCHLVSDSMHHHEKHLEVFVNSVRSVVDGSALLCAPRPLLGDHEHTVFIGHNANYYHWLIEDIPRLGLAECSTMLGGREVLVDKDIQPWQLDLLARFGFSEERLRRSPFDRPIIFRDVLLPSRLSTHGVVHPDAARFVRDSLLQHSPASPKRGKRLYVTRRAVPGRALLNADEITGHFARAGFSVVDPGGLSIDQQIEIFSDAEVIAGPAGAGLANIIFAPAEARLIQLGSTDVCAETYTSLAAVSGQRSCWCFGRGFARAYPRWILTNFDFFVDRRDVDICLDRML
jgi:capsular polysaccharide biosynthesis protein